MPSALANQTLARLQQARRSREAVSLPEVIKLIEELSSRAFSISVQELADLISHDTLVTAKIIQAANTFGFNPFGLPVTTVTQAIHVVGFNKIRNLALSVLLLDNATQGAHPEVQRESAAIALCSGLVARTLAGTRPVQDAEQAFVFACLRHYGRLLLTTFLPEDFAQVQQRPAAESETDACRRVFGLTPLELTSLLFEESRLPRPILRCLQDIPAGQLVSPAANSEDELAAITQFSATLGELVITPRIGANSFADEAERLRRTFDAKLTLPENAMADLVGAVDQSLRAFARAYGTRAVASGVLQRISERATQAEPQPTLPAEIVMGATSAPAPAATTAEGAVSPPPSAVAASPLSAGESAVRPPSPALAEPPPPPDGTAILTECLLKLTELMTAASIDLRAMETAVLASIREALHLRDCLLFQRETSSGEFSAAIGLGDLFELVRGRPLIDANRRDVFGIALSRREDVLIRNTADAKLRPFLPEWLMGAGHVASFILLPLQSDAGAFALIVGTRTTAPALQPNPRELQLLKAVRQHLASARRLAGIRN